MINFSSAIIWLSILIPFPYSLDNHQIVNARYLSDKKAAILINEENFDLISGYKIFKELLFKYL